MPKQIDRDGYCVLTRDDFVSEATYRHYKDAYNMIDARPTGRRAGSRVTHNRRAASWDQSGDLGIVRERGPGYNQRDLSEMRQHISVCMGALEEDARRFGRFKWFKRNLYRALRYRRGTIREEVLLDMIDDYLIKILKDPDAFIPRPRHLASELRARGDKYGC